MPFGFVLSVTGVVCDNGSMKDRIGAREGWGAGWVEERVGFRSASLSITVAARGLLRNFLPQLKVDLRAIILAIWHTILLPTSPAHVANCSQKRHSIQLGGG